MVRFLSRLLGGSGNYAYVTARVRAKKAKLIPQEEYPKLLARDPSEIAKYLQEGTYKAEIDELAGRYRGAELIERATRMQLGRTYSDIQGYAKGELAAMIGTYLARYDVYNVKTLLRGRFARQNAEVVLSETVPAGFLAPRLPELARTESMEDLVEALSGTPFGRILQKHVEGRTLSSLMPVENDLDRHYYEALLESIPSQGAANRVYLAWVRNEIDLMNLKTLFRLRFARVTDWEPYFLPGGEQVTRESAQRIVRGADDEVVQEISTLSVAPEVVDNTRAALAAGAMDNLSSSLDRELLRDAHDFSHRAPLSVLPVVDFVLRKKIEADNLRAIAYGKQTGLPPQTIKELLITL